MASTQARSGTTAFERQHAWAIANQMKNHMLLKKQELQDVSSLHVKSPRLEQAVQAEYHEAMAAFDQAKSALVELGDRATARLESGSVQGGLESSGASNNNAAASGSDVDRNVAEPEPEADTELVAGLQKEVSAADAEQSTINWARAYVDLPPDSAHGGGPDDAVVGCEADQEETSASAFVAGQESDGHQQQVQGEAKNEQESTSLPTAVGMIRRRHGKAASGHQ